VIKNKYIILPFLFVAWTIIFAHSIVPHHHAEKSHTECNHHAQNANFEESTEIHNCNHDGNDHVCHFHVEVLTKASIDNIFIADTENAFFNYLSFSETNKNTFNTNFVFENIPKTNHLRGPPIIS
jgi:hypothetical protein